MAPQFNWREEYNIGVDAIDKDHQQLFKIINKLLAFREEEKDSEWLGKEGVKFFKGHALKHFAGEEEYMASIGYKDLERHRKIHNSFRDNTLPALIEELDRTGYSLEALDHFLGVCTGWLIGHTMTEDLAITGDDSGRWENLLPEEEIVAVKKVIVQLVFNMFRLESRLISDAYCGEKFGKGVYYRLVYGNGKEKKRQEIIMVFEEKLLINTVGKAMGIKTNKLDAMLIHASRYTAKQFVKRVIEHFPSMDGYELKEENLLSYEQFERVLKKQKLQVSLLFNTGGAGYFAYCMIAPHLLEEGIGRPIQSENAIVEVEQYLKEREVQKKKEEEDKRPKILIVDDSKTIRQFISDMLSDEYDVAVAESGIAAIRSITLNRPDLVLLDYEMPICDGKQTLEMLRSEKEFADLPVIFLTGKSDLDSVKKVMHLKPEGYLLKYLQPEAIKKEIRAFFKKKKAGA